MTGQGQHEAKIDSAFVGPWHFHDSLHLGAFTSIRTLRASPVVVDRLCFRVCVYRVFCAAVLEECCIVEVAGLRNWKRTLCWLISFSIVFDLAENVFAVGRKLHSKRPF
jgi:hypothetical protein